MAEGLPPFEVHVDKQAGIVRTVLRGFWTMDDLMGFGAAMMPAVGAVAARHRFFGLLGDSTEFKVQSNEVSEAFTAMTAAGAASHEGPGAIVVGSMLNKLQAERAFAGQRVRIFTDSRAARRWIEEELARLRGGTGTASAA